MGIAGYFIIAYFVGVICGLILGVYLSKQRLASSNIVQSAELQHYIECLTRCENKGFKFGSPEFDACVAKCDIRSR